MSNYRDKLISIYRDAGVPEDVIQATMQLKFTSLGLKSLEGISIPMGINEDFKNTIDQFPLPEQRDTKRIKEDLDTSALIEVTDDYVSFTGFDQWRDDPNRKQFADDTFDSSDKIPLTSKEDPRDYFRKYADEGFLSRFSADNSMDYRAGLTTKYTSFATYFHDVLRSLRVTTHVLGWIYDENGNIKEKGGDVTFRDFPFNGFSASYIKAMREIYSEIDDKLNKDLIRLGYDSKKLKENNIPINMGILQLTTAIPSDGTKTFTNYKVGKHIKHMFGYMDKVLTLFKNLDETPHLFGALGVDYILFPNRPNDNLAEMDPFSNLTNSFPKKEGYHNFTPSGVRATIRGIIKDSIIAPLYSLQGIVKSGSEGGAPHHIIEMLKGIFESMKNVSHMGEYIEQHLSIGDLYGSSPFYKYLTGNFQNNPLLGSERMNSNTSHSIMHTFLFRLFPTFTDDDIRLFYNSPSDKAYPNEIFNEDNVSKMCSFMIHNDRKSLQERSFMDFHDEDQWEKVDLSRSGSPNLAFAMSFIKDAVDRLGMEKFLQIKRAMYKLNVAPYLYYESDKCVDSAENLNAFTLDFIVDVLCLITSSDSIIEFVTHHKDFGVDVRMDMTNEEAIDALNRRINDNQDNLDIYNEQYSSEPEKTDFHEYLLCGTHEGYTKNMPSVKAYRKAQAAFSNDPDLEILSDTTQSQIFFDLVDVFLVNFMRFNNFNMINGHAIPFNIAKLQGDSNDEIYKPTIVTTPSGKKVEVWTNTVLASIINMDVYKVGLNSSTKQGEVLKATINALTKVNAKIIEDPKYSPDITELVLLADLFTLSGVDERQSGYALSNHLFGESGNTYKSANALMSELDKYLEKS